MICLSSIFFSLGLRGEKIQRGLGRLLDANALEKSFAIMYYISKYSTYGKEFSITCYISNLHILFSGKEFSIIYYISIYSLY